METLIYLLKSASILTLFYFVYFIVLRKDTFFSSNRYYLIGGIIASLLLPFVVFTKTIYIDAPVSNSFVSFYNNPISNPIIEAQAYTIDWWNVISIIYFVGALYMSLRFTKQLISLFTLIKNTPYRKANGFRYIKINEDINPFSFLKYIVYNPEKHTESELKMILKHEQIHAFQLHSIDIIIANILLIIQWMNPIGWLYKKSIEENLEFIADSETIQQIPSKKEYQLSLLKVITSNSLQPVLANNFYQSLIKKRIIMLHKKSSNTQNQWKLLLILPLLGVFLWSFNVEEEIKYNDYVTIEPVVDTSTEPILLKEEIITPKVIENKLFSEKKNNKFIDSKITVTVDKNTSDTELEKLKKLFKDSYNVTLKFSGIKRNSAGEIIKIKVSMKSKDSNASFNQDDSDGIGEFKISYDDATGSISIGNNNAHQMHVSSGEGNHYFHEIKEDEHGNVSTWISKDGNKVKKGKHEYIIHKDGNREVIHINSDSDNHSSVWVTKDGNHIKKESHHVIIDIDSDSDEEDHIIHLDSDEDSIFVHKSDDHGFFFVDSDGKDPLVFIDGKKSSKKEMEKLGSNAIETIEILKGDKAIEKYGKDAKDGVILIITKKK